MKVDFKKQVACSNDGRS